MLHGSVTQPGAGLAGLPAGQGRALWGGGKLLSRGFLWVSFLSWCLCGHLPVSFGVFCSELGHAEHCGTVFFSPSVHLLFWEHLVFLI